MWLLKAVSWVWCTRFESLLCYSLVCNKILHHSEFQLIVEKMMLLIYLLLRDIMKIIWNNHTHTILWHVGRAQQKVATIITWDSLGIAKPKNGLWPMLPPHTPEHLAPFPKPRPAGARAGPLFLSQVPLNSEFTMSISSVLKSSTSCLGCYRESVLENYAQQANAVSVRILFMFFFL